MNVLVVLSISITRSLSHRSRLSIAIIVKGDRIQRGERKFVDYILYYKANKPLAIIEAKDNNHSVGAGMQQGLDYGEILDIPYVYSSNGDAFIEHDMTGQEKRKKLSMR